MPIARLWESTPEQKRINPLGTLILLFEISLEARADWAVQLRRMELVEPRSALGGNSVEALQCGAHHGVAGKVDGLVGLDSFLSGISRTRQRQHPGHRRQAVDRSLGTRQDWGPNPQRDAPGVIATGRCDLGSGIDFDDVTSVVIYDGWVFLGCRSFGLTFFSREGSLWRACRSNCN